MDDLAADTNVDALVAAYERDAPAVESLSGSYDAYAVQGAVVRRLCRLWATQVSGYKLSFTLENPPPDGLASSPAYGRILARQVEPDGVTLPLDRAPLVEVELLFRARERLTAELTLDDLMSRTLVRPMVEVPVSRFREWWPQGSAPRISRDEFIADNCVAMHVVAGGSWSAATTIEPDEVTVTLSCPDGSIERGHARAVMGSPVTALAWLVDQVGQVEAGAIVATGTITAPVRASQGTYIADFGERLGRVSVGFT